MKIRVHQNYKSLKSGITWNSIPKLAILTGKNGSGKTQLLEYISQNIRHSDRISEILCSQQELNFINSRWEPKTNPQVNLNNLQQNITVMNQSLLNYFKQKRTSPNAKHITFDPILKDIAISLGKTEAELSEEDVKNNIPIDIQSRLKEMDEFRRIFVAYETKYHQECAIAVRENDKDTLKKLNKQKSPSDIINSLFEKYDFHYELLHPDLINGYNSIEFKDKNNDKTVPLENLSDGEKMIISLIMWSHNPQTGKRVKCLLLDEPDSFLHPSMSKMLIEIIQDKFISEFGTQVIMTTHSPSTIAYSPEESIFVMQKEDPRIQKQSKSQAIKMLSDGFVSIVSDDIENIIQYETTKTEKPVLFVEGVTDEIILKKAWEIINPDKELPIKIQNMYDCYQIVNSFKRGDMFDNSPTHIFIGLLDYDDAYKNLKEWKGLKTDYQQVPNILLWKNKTKNGYIFPLPIPTIRTDYAGETLKNSYLSIELLFKDNIISPYCREERVAGGGTIKIFKDSKKMTFATNIVANLEVGDFQNFISIFNIIEKIAEDKL